MTTSAEAVDTMIDIATVREGVRQWMKLLEERGGLGDGTYRTLCGFLMQRLFLGSAPDQEVITLLRKFALRSPAEAIIEERKRC
jgi:hypothetical protein